MTGRRGTRAIGAIALTVLISAGLAVVRAPVAGAAVPARSLASSCGTASEPLFDVGPANPHHPGISCLYLWDIATGTGPGRYSPDLPVSRAQMATFIARLLSEAGETLPSSPPARFRDVAAGSTHEHSINQLAALGVVTGDGDRYRPDGLVSRAQMTSFIGRASAIVAGSTLPDGPDAFVDDTGDVHEANINRAAHAGIATGTSATTFSPAASVTRAQMGSFLARTIALLVDAYGVPTRATDDRPIEGPLFRFLVPPGAMGNDQPGRWDPCAAPTIPWQIVGSADAAWESLVAEAFASAAAASGLSLPREQGSVAPRRIDVSFPPNSRFPPGVGGIATPSGGGTAGGELEITYATLELNADFLEAALGPGGGSIGAEEASILALHEVAHVLGLDHVDDARLLMADTLDSSLQDPRYGAGELEGLRLVGASQGCLP